MQSFQRRISIKIFMYTVETAVETAASPDMVAVTGIDGSCFWHALFLHCYLC